MTRIVAVALLVALLAGAGVLAAGGVAFSPDQQADLDREAARPFEVPSPSEVLPPTPKLAPVAAPSAGRLGATVSMRDLRFATGRVRVRAGESVQWVNRDESAHRLMAQDGGGAGSAPSFRSGEIRPGESFRTTFPRPGTVRYVCVLHPLSMVATVVVR